MDMRILTKDAHSSEQEDKSVFCNGTKCEGALPVSPYENQEDGEKDDELKDISLEIAFSGVLKTPVASGESKPAGVQAEHVLLEHKQLGQDPLVPSGDNLINQLKDNPPARQMHQSSGKDQCRHQPADKRMLKSKGSLISLVDEKRSPDNHIIRTKEEYALPIRPTDTRKQVPVREVVDNRQDNFTRSTVSAADRPNSDHVLYQKAKPKEMRSARGHRMHSSTLSKDKLMASRDDFTTNTVEERSVTFTETGQLGTPLDNMERVADASVHVVQPKEIRIQLPEANSHSKTANPTKSQHGKNLTQTLKPESSSATETALEPIALQSEEKTVPLYSDYDPIAKGTLHFVLRRACCVSFSASLYGDDDNDDVYTPRYPYETLDHTEAKPEPVFPETLEEFGYYFNEVGELRTIENNERFKFVVKEDDPEYNERRYRALEKVIVDSICRLLKQYANLDKVAIPGGVNIDDQKGLFFMTPAALDKETLLLLVNGSGVLQAGKWCSRLIATDVSRKNSKLPYIDFAQKQDYGIILLNTNWRTAGGNRQPQTSQIHASESTDDQVLYLWDHFLESSEVKHIAVIEHTYDGRVTSRLSNEREVFRERLFAIAFIDIVHCRYRLSKQTKHLFAEHAINWIRSNEPEDTELQEHDDLKCRSAGHPLHEWTPASAKESIFSYILEKHQKIQDHQEAVNRPRLCSCM